MSTGSFAFSGEQCEITVTEKGSSNVQRISAQITGLDASGFERGVSTERTFGAYRYNYQGYSNANVNISFVYDQDDEVLGAGSNIPMIGFMGGSYSVGSSGISGYTLNPDSDVPPQKIKLLFREHNNSFGDSLTDSERAMKFIFYNARGTNVDASVSPDGLLTGELTFMVSPFAVNGSSNYVEFEKPSGESVTNFNSVETDYDGGMGY